MGMKINQIEKVSQPKHHVKQIDKAVVKFKPTAIHTEAIGKEKAKKVGKSYLIIYSILGWPENGAS